MDIARVAVWLTVGIIVSVTIISGPLVGAVDFTPNTSNDDGTFAPGTGKVDVEVHSLPTEAKLEKGSYGAGAYYLRVPDATVNIKRVEGQPMLVYKLRIPEMGFSRGTTHFLDAGTAGTRNIALEEGTLAPDKVTKDSYAGELLILVRAGDGERIVTRQNVTVDVRR